MEQKCKQVSAAVTRGVADTFDLSQLPEGSWGERHVKESEFNKSKLQQRRLEAVVANSLLEDELNDGLMGEAFVALGQAQKNRAKRARKESKTARQIERGDVPVPSLTECTIYIPDEVRTAAIDAVLAAHDPDWQLACDAVQATIIVSTDADDETIQCAALTGAWLVPPHWVTSDQHYDAWALKYKAAIHTKRIVWMSNDAKASFPEQTRMIRAAASLPASRWVIVDSVATWVVQKQHAMDKKNPAMVIALVTAVEKDAYVGVRHIFDIHEFWAFVTNLDTERSAMGMACN